MRGFKTDIHTVREVANARQSWDYAPGVGATVCSTALEHLT